MQSTPESLYLVVGLFVKKKKIIIIIIGKLLDTAGRTGLLKFTQYWALEKSTVIFLAFFSWRELHLGFEF